MDEELLSELYATKILLLTVMREFLLSRPDRKELAAKWLELAIGGADQMTVKGKNFDNPAFRERIIERMGQAVASALKAGTPNTKHQ